MRGTLASWPLPDSVFPGSREKQPRAFDEARRVPVLGEYGVVVDICTQDTVGHYAAAPNAEVKRRTDGSIRFVRLRSLGDDRGHLGECHGRSTVTTERIRNDRGRLVGGAYNLRHKEICSAWGSLSATPEHQHPNPFGQKAARFIRQDDKR